MSAAVSERLRRVAGYSRSEQDSAARDLARVKAELDAEEARLESLYGYYRDYSRGLRERRENGGSSVDLLNYGAFLDRLKEALSEQERQVETRRTAFEAQRQLWLEQRARTSALNKAADRKARAESGARSRAEQSDLDDLSLQRLLLGGR